MKAIYRLMLLATIAISGSAFVSCSEDELGPSIFDTTEHPLDPNSYTYSLDAYLKNNYLDPYNVKFIYKMEDVGSDMDKNLVPASYDKSVKLAALTKYLWFDVYAKHAGEKELFLKKYSPRIIHVIGSKSYSPSQGTETLGVTEGGIKITLYGANDLNEENVEHMNKYFFHTMHHEFAHLLDQNVVRDPSFNKISNTYNSTGWTDVPDSVSNGLGFVTSYASESYSEDLVETASTYITADTIKWTDILNTATFEWEDIDSPYETEDAFFTAYPPYKTDIDTVGYYHETESGTPKIYRKRCLRDPVTDYVILDEEGKVQWSHDQPKSGKELILEKLDYVRNWLQSFFGISIDEVRKEVQTRTFLTDENGDFVIDNRKMVNRLTYNNGELMKRLMEEVEKSEVKPSAK